MTPTSAAWAAAAVGLVTGPLVDQRITDYGHVFASQGVLRGAPRPETRCLVPVVQAMVFGALAIRVGPTPALPPFLLVAAAGVFLTVVDLRHHRLPDRVTGPTTALSLVLFGAAAMLARTPAPLVRAVLGMTALFVIFLLLALLSPAGIGFGDVKLAGVLGLCTAWLGWRTWSAGLALTFMTAAGVAVVLLLVGRGSRTTTMPFGPFMLVAALTAVLLGGGTR